jgi:predicted anti-sigma-YlaC factor YlaD
MRCEPVRDRLPGYADGDPRPVEALDEHVASCARCRVELQEYREVRELLGEMAGGVESPGELLPLLLQLIPPAVAQRECYGAGHGTRARYALAPLGGAAVGATAIALVLWRRTRQEPETEASERAAV